VIVVTLLLVTRVVAAGESGANREADHAALRVLLANATQAINNQDLDALKSLFLRDFVFVAVDQTVLTSTAAIKGYYDRMLRQPDSPVSGFKMAPRAEILARYMDATTALCYGTSDDTYTLRRNGRRIHMRSRWTATVVKADGQWRIAMVHSGVNFLDNPVLASRNLSWRRKCLLAIGIGKSPGEP
jgi:uncharacterized protein (TIGR02246 family)